MLSTQSAQVVKATLPVIGAAIGDITPVFYKRMFAAHPELERDLFNRGNQAQGDQQITPRSTQSDHDFCCARRSL